VALTWPIVAIVLVGALLHASWNALIKSGGDKSLDTALIHVLGVFVAIPVVAVVGFPDAASWPYLAASLATHVGYYIALVGAYKHGELGMTYPIMRGLAPLLVACVSGALIGESLSAAAWLGVAGISVGVVAVGLSRSAATSGHAGKALRYALANAAIIATYTVIDGLGVRVSGNAIAYVATLVLFDGIPFALIVLWRRRARRAEVLAYVAGRWKFALAGSLASLGSYGIALWAMTRAPVASVAALRETSVLFAALIGVWWLKEGFGPQRALGTALIVGGVMALRLT
jgi:phosphonate utilization associated putative membrane protein